MSGVEEVLPGFLSWGSLATIISVLGGIIAIIIGYQQITDRQTNKIEAIFNRRTEHMKEDICKDFHNMGDEIRDFKNALRDHIKEDDEVHGRVSMLETDVAVLQRLEEDNRKQIDVHTHQIDKLQDR